MKTGRDVPRTNVSCYGVPLSPPSGGPQVPAGAVVRVVHAHLVPAVPHPAGDRHGHSAVPRDGCVGPRDGDALLPHCARLAPGAGRDFLINVYKKINKYW